jgi:cytoskeletal protein RodZ
MTPRDSPRRPDRDSAEQLDAGTLARSRRKALRGRARRIRRSIAASAAVLFCALFLVVYVQLASGHDPALSAASKNTATAGKVTAKASESSSSSTQSSGTESTGTESSGTKSSSTESTGGESSSSPSAVTTKQS